MIINHNGDDSDKEPLNDDEDDDVNRSLTRKALTQKIRSVVNKYAELAHFYFLPKAHTSLEHH